MSSNNCKEFGIEQTWSSTLRASPEKFPERGGANEKNTEK